VSMHRPFSLVIRQRRSAAAADRDVASCAPALRVPVPSTHWPAGRSNSLRSNIAPGLPRPARRRPGGRKIGDLPIRHSRRKRYCDFANCDFSPYKPISAAPPLLVDFGDSSTDLSE
jgi:hypothetical protein